MRLATLAKSSCLAAMLLGLLGFQAPAYAEDSADKLIEKVKEQVVLIDTAKEDLKTIRSEFTDRMHEVMMLRMRFETGGNPKLIARELEKVAYRTERAEMGFGSCKEGLATVGTKLERFEERALKIDDPQAKRAVKRAQRQLEQTEAYWERVCRDLDDVKLEIGRLFEDITEP